MAELLGWIWLVLAVALIAGWYLSFSASRIDRLHHRVESSLAALEAQLLRRAGVAAELAPHLSAPAGPRLKAAAAVALAEPAPVSEDGREAQNHLTRALAGALDTPADVNALGHRADGMLDDLTVAVGRAQLARRFHNDAVSQAQRVRGKRVVRWFRLAGRAPMPRMVEIDDSTPPGLEGRDHVPGPASSGGS